MSGFLSSGVVPTNLFGIAPEDFDIIAPNQDLYCVSEQSGQILKLSRTLFTNYWGDLLITQEGSIDPIGYPPKLLIVHWDNTTTNFIIRNIPSSVELEHVTFAPINLPSIP